LWRRIQFVLSKPLWAVVTVHPPLRLSSGNSRSNCANCQAGLGPSILAFYLACHEWLAEMKFFSLNGLGFNRQLLGAWRLLSKQIGAKVQMRISRSQGPYISQGVPI
jgi:hypothetical protein